MSVLYGTADRQVERRARFVDYRHTRSQDLRNRLVRRHMPLAQRIASRFSRRGVAYDDLVQTASVGLVNAVDRFDPFRGIPFEAFAAPTISGEIKRHFRNRAWDLRVPRRLQERYLAVNAAVERITQQSGGAPTVAQLARAVGIDEEEVVEALETAAAFNADSLSRPCEGGAMATMADTIGADDPWLRTTVDRLLVAELIDRLPAREQLIIRLRFWDGLSQAAIAERLGVSQMHVSRLLRRSFHHLHEILDEV